MSHSQSPIRLHISLFFAALFLNVAAVHAESIVVNGSGILNQSGANQLASWLGEGDLTLTNIFSHSIGDGKTTSSFHAAADGKGRNFVLFEVSSVKGVATDLIIGGYAVIIHSEPRYTKDLDVWVNPNSENASKS